MRSSRLWWITAGRGTGVRQARHGCRHSGTKPGRRRRLRGAPHAVGADTGSGGNPTGRAARRLGAAARSRRGGLRARMDAPREHRRRAPAAGASRLRRPRSADRHSRYRHRSRGGRAGHDLDGRAQGARSARLLRRRRRPPRPGDASGRHGPRGRPDAGGVRTGGRPQHHGAVLRRHHLGDSPRRAAGGGSQRQRCGARHARRRGRARHRRLGSPGRHRRRRLPRGRAAGARLSRRPGDVRLGGQGRQAQGDARRQLLRCRRRAQARSLLRYRVPRHARGGHRRGARHLRRGRVQRRGAGRAAPGAQDRQQRPGRDLDVGRDAARARSTPSISPSRAGSRWCSISASAWGTRSRVRPGSTGWWIPSWRSIPRW